MGVRPPQDEGSEPDAIEFGIAALAPRLDDADIDWPATADEIVGAVGNSQVPYDAAGNTVSLAEALDDVPKQRFESKSEVLDLLHPVFEEYRSNRSHGVIGQLRQLLPF
jgi:hypothetical protein